MSISVLAAGFGGTGAAALKLALTQLGFGPCYDLPEAEQNPAHAALWRAAVDGDPVDWDELLGGYTSLTGWPAVGFWLDLMYEYPDARVILTTRDPGPWCQDVSDSVSEALARTQQGGDNTVDGHILRHVFEYGVSDGDEVADEYHKHVQSVCQTVPTGRLLVYDVSDGWGPLCEFLEVQTPADPFPTA